MLSKFLHIVVLIIVSLTAFMVHKLSNSLKMIPKNQELSGVSMSVIEVEKPEIKPDFPQIWANLPKEIKKIYLSYEPADIVLTTEVAKAIEKDGRFSVYMSQKNDMPLKNQPESIKALKTMDAFVIFYTQNYQTGLTSNQEYGFSVSTGKPNALILPSVITQDALKYSNYVIEMNPENYMMIAEEILKAIESQKPESTISYPELPNL